jgi:uncharacterized Zn finger protein
MRRKPRLEIPTAPCPRCGAGEFILWRHREDAAQRAISCAGCGAVLSSTHPLDSDDRPVRRFVSSSEKCEYE